MKFPYLLLILGVLFLSVLDLAAQTAAMSPQRTVTAAEIEKLEEDAHSYLKKLSYRVKTTDIHFSDDEKSPYSSHTEIYEVLLKPSRLRSVHEWKDKQGVRRRELINLGNQVYLKNGDDPWRIFKYPPVFIDGTPFYLHKTIPGAVYEYEYLYLGEENLNGFSSDVYQTNLREIYRHQEFEVINLLVNKLWFDKKKRLLKKEFSFIDGRNQLDSRVKIPKEFEDNMRGAILSERKTTEYEYDVPIKIEAPIK